MQKEGQTVEFKLGFTPDIKKEAAAFANSQGGTILIGVADDGRVHGVSNTDQVLLQATNAIRDGIRPDVTIFTQYEVESLEGKNVIRITVQRGTARPYYLSDKGMKPAGVYVRQGSSSAPASEEAIRRMIAETDGGTFENIRSLNQDLTFEYTAGEAKKHLVAFGPSQMRTLGVTDENGLYTNLGLLLSDQCRHTIKAAYFEGTDKKVFKDRKEFVGPVLKQLAECYAYIDLLNKTKATFEGLDRIDERDYPEEAIREALLNCIVHRDYSFSGSILINIFEDRIEMVSLGGLVPGLTREAIMIGVSQPRNEHLADFLYRLGLIEAYGTGIGKIFSSYKHVSKKPDIETADGAFRVTMPNVHAAGSVIIRKEILTEQYNKVLSLFETAESIMRKDVEVCLGVGQTRAIALLKEMAQAGLIQQTGSGRSTAYIQIG